MNLYKWLIQIFTFIFCWIALSYSNDLFTDIVISMISLYNSYLNFKEPLL
jgi:hypothetical protein